jgi:homocysteine S-methyltransferase
MNFSSENLFSVSNLKGKPLILDGAMGSLLQQRGFQSKDSTWMTMVNQNFPETIISTHKEYIEAGADIITTNTFRTNPLALEKLGISNSIDYVKNAVFLSKEAATNSSVIIAGSNAPAEDCYQKKRQLTKKQLELNHYNHIDLLINNGVDFILNETQSHLDEIMIICKFCKHENIPYVLSLYVDDNLKLLSGESIEVATKFIQEHNPLAIGFNCIDPGVFSNIMNNSTPDFVWGFYLNCGAVLPTNKDVSCGIAPEKYMTIIKKYVGMNPSFIGSCCCSSPEHTRSIRMVIDG